MRRTALPIALLVLDLALGLGSVRPAQAAEDSKQLAKAHYETATRLYEVQEYAKALDEYKTAYLAKPDPAFLFNIGQCYRKLGDDSKALEFFHQYLKKAPPEDPSRAQGEARIRDIETSRSKPPETVPASPPAVVGGPPPSLTGPPPGTPPETPRVDLTATSIRTEEPNRKPVLKTWWFWTGVGAVVAAGAVTAIVLSTSHTRSNVPSVPLGTRSVFQ
jgi:tetratricopeptide (TPR) repeat protein